MRRAKPGNQRPKRVRPPGAVVLQVDPQSAAERAGLKLGDLVTELDGTPVRDAADLRPQAGAAADRRSRRRRVAPGRRGDGARRNGGTRAGRALQMMPHQESASETAPRSIYDPGGQHHWGGQRRCSKRLVQCGECVELRSIRGAGPAATGTRRLAGPRREAQDELGSPRLALLRIGEVAEFAVSRPGGDKPGQLGGIGIRLGPGVIGEARTMAASSRRFSSLHPFRRRVSRST
jgi:hypothetical protein